MDRFGEEEHATLQDNQQGKLGSHTGRVFINTYRERKLSVQEGKSSSKPQGRARIE